MKLKSMVFAVALAAVGGLGFVGGSLDTQRIGWIGLQQAEATPYRRSVRRTARRTARRTSARYDAYPYRGGAVAVGAAAATAIAIGTVVRSLPPSCTTVMVDGVTYHRCSGTSSAESEGVEDVVEQALGLDLDHPQHPHQVDCLAGEDGCQSASTELERRVAEIAFRVKLDEEGFARP